MNIKRIKPPQGFLEKEDSENIWQFPEPPGYAGHAHFWERAVSRRNFVRAAAGAAGAALAAGPVVRALAQGTSNTGPKPIPGGTQLPFLPPGKLIHFFLPGPGHEVSTITDFNGFVGLANVNGTGMGTDTTTGIQTRLIFKSDNRFMKGVFVGQDGQTHTGTFAFI